MMNATSAAATDNHRWTWVCPRGSVAATRWLSPDNAVPYNTSRSRSKRRFRETPLPGRLPWVEAVRSIADSMVVEGEVGFIGSGSEIHDIAPDAAHILTTTDEATQFVAATHVDVLAPAVGDMHGMLRQMVLFSAP